MFWSFRSRREIDKITGTDLILDMVSRLVTSDKIRHKSGKGYYLDEVHPFTGTVLDIYDNGQKSSNIFTKMA